MNNATSKVHGEGKGAPLLPPGLRLVRSLSRSLPLSLSVSNLILQPESSQVAYRHLSSPLFLPLSLCTTLPLRALLLLAFRLASSSRSSFFRPAVGVDVPSSPTHSSTLNPSPGWTEYELVVNAQPRFPGHIQPNIPKWLNASAENTPQGAAMRIAAATKAGATRTRTLLERPIQKDRLRSARQSLLATLVWRC